MVYGGYFCKIVVLSDILSPRTSLITDIAMNEISLLQVSHNTKERYLITYSFQEWFEFFLTELF
jgi:hypothetical protein